MYPFFVRSPDALRIDTFDFNTEAVITAGDGDVGNVFHHYNGKFSAHQRVYVIDGFRRVDPRYFYFYFSSEFRRAVSYGGAATTVASLRRPMFTSFPVCVPPRDEQQQIAEFLDYETSEIDAFIADQERPIELLTERRSATIADRIVRASDASEPTALKHLATVQAGITLGSAYDEPTAPYPYLRVANVQTGFVATEELKEVDVPEYVARSTSLRAGDVLMTEGGDRDKLGRGGIWDARVSPCLHQNHVFAIRCGKRLLPEFLVYTLDAPAARRYFEAVCVQTARTSITGRYCQRHRSGYGISSYPRGGPQISGQT